MSNLSSSKSKTSQMTKLVDSSASTAEEVVRAIDAHSYDWGKTLLRASDDTLSDTRSGNSRRYLWRDRSNLIASALKVKSCALDPMANPSRVYEAVHGLQTRGMGTVNAQLPWLRNYDKAYRQWTDLTLNEQQLFVASLGFPPEMLASDDPCRSLECAYWVCSQDESSQIWIEQLGLQQQYGGMIQAPPLPYAQLEGDEPRDYVTDRFDLHQGYRHPRTGNRMNTLVQYPPQGHNGTSCTVDSLVPACFSALDAPEYNYY